MWRARSCLPRIVTYARRILGETRNPPKPDRVKPVASVRYNKTQLPLTELRQCSGC